MFNRFWECQRSSNLILVRPKTLSVTQQDHNVPFNAGLTVFHTNSQDYNSQQACIIDQESPCVLHYIHRFYDFYLDDSFSALQLYAMFESHNSLCNYWGHFLLEEDAALHLIQYKKRKTCLLTSCF